MKQSYNIISRLTIKERLVFAIALLNTLIMALVIVSVVNLKLLTGLEPDSQAAADGLHNALLIVILFGAVCIICGFWLLWKLPSSISQPITDLSEGIKQIANHNYDVSVDLPGGVEMSDVSRNFNRMAKRLRDYHNSTTSALMSSNHYLETIINSIDEPIICMDKSGNVIFVNDEALEILNMRRESVLSKSANELSLRNDLLRKLLCDMEDVRQKDDEARIREPLKIFADNKESYFIVKYIEILMPGNEADTMEKRGDVIMLKNITEFHKLDVAKTSFISTISHELKTPISAILMSQQLLEDQRIGFLNSEQLQYSQSIRENSERLLAITAELLNMTQVESGKLQLKPSRTRVEDLIDYAVKANKIQAEKASVNIKILVSEDSRPEIFVDGEKIAWVLTNLLSNAIRYSFENSDVEIGCQDMTDRVEIFVQDYGKGIDSKYHQSIFEHYFRVPGNSAQGSGLGLSISRDFMEAHGGSIRVDSSLGCGSRFTISIPKV